MNWVLFCAAIAEIAAGVALFVAPSTVGLLLLGTGFAGIAASVARVAGIALIGLGLACWPGPPIIGMLAYSASVALYLAYVGFADGMNGMLLWPAVVLHITLSFLLARTWQLGDRTKSKSVAANDTDQ